METWGEKEYRDWYGEELARVERLANRQSAEVRATLEWSLPLLRGLAKGEIEPVLPPPPTPRGTRFLDWIKPAPKRPVLRAKRKAPAIAGMSDVIEAP
jgi:hypothetical protein